MYPRVSVSAALVGLCFVFLPVTAARPDEGGKEQDSPPSAVDPEEGRRAVERGLAFLEKDAAKWRKEHECSTCHHGTMTVFAYSEAKSRGYEVPPETLSETVKWAKERLERIDQPRDPRPGWKMVSTPAIYLALMARCVDKQAAVGADDLRRISGHIIRHQEDDGSWAWSSAPPINRPPPFFESDEVATRLACLALERCVPDDPGKASEVRESRERAAAWLARTGPGDDTQAAALQMLMEVRPGDPVETVERGSSRLLERQNGDGGWGQLRDLPSDAYATGLAMYALSLVGLKSDRAEIRRAIAFLVASQREDGSWLMKSRAQPGATPYKNPVPIVYFGSAWATLGLIRCVQGPAAAEVLHEAAAPAPPQKAFPTAEGFGASALGGRGGRVIEVTNLDDSGPGSFRSVVEGSGPRICVFRVSGTITLKSAVRVSTPYLTVAGQTSPGGVEIRGSGQPEGDWGVWFVNGAHDIVLRHLRVRMGGGMKHDAGNNILFYGTAEPGVRDVIVDHCSVSWGSDTQLDWYGSYLDRATFQWNLIGECFVGQHIGGNRAPKNITLHHNLYANLGSRTPLMQHADVFDFRNNVIYNWSGNNASVFGQFALNSSAFGNVVDNLWLAGPESGYPYLNVGNGGSVRIDGKAAEAGGTRLYLSGNWGPESPTGSANDWTGHGVNTWDHYELEHDGSTHLVDQAQYDAGKPFPAPLVHLDPVSTLADKVLLGVGACKPSRDAIDQRIVKSVRDRSGTSRGDKTGPWPDLAGGAPAPPVDADHDGMPDAWERAHGLDPGNAGDGAAVAANGYTNVENYLNELAGDPVFGPGFEK
jgi:hypothetical protein